MEEGRQREQDEIYRGDHDAGGRGREVPTGTGGGGDEVRSHCPLRHARRLPSLLQMTLYAEPSVQGRARRLSGYTGLADDSRAVRQAVDASQVAIGQSLASVLGRDMVCGILVKVMCHHLDRRRLERKPEVAAKLLSC